MKSLTSKTRISSIFASVLLLSACATVEIGREFDPQKFESTVKRGETTQADVQAMFGPPISTGLVVERDGSKYQRWLYYHAKSRVHKLGEAKLKMLEIRFNAQLKVDNYNWSAE